MILFSWIMIDLWGRVLDNLSYGTLGLNQNSTYHSLIVAVTVTLIFFVTIIYLGDTGKKIKENMTGITAVKPVTVVTEF